MLCYVVLCGVLLCCVVFCCVVLCCVMLCYIKLYSLTHLCCIVPYLPSNWHVWLHTHCTGLLPQRRLFFNEAITAVCWPCSEQSMYQVNPTESEAQAPYVDPVPENMGSVDPLGQLTPWTPWLRSLWCLVRALKGWKLDCAFSWKRCWLGQYTPGWICSMSPTKTACHSCVWSWCTKAARWSSFLPTSNWKNSFCS